MRYFFYQLNSPRPSFPADITPAETQLMQAHAMYWRGLMAKGMVLAFGPVADPKGSFGIAVVRLEEGVDEQLLAANDPINKADIGFHFNIFPMPQLLHPGT
ncbi:MAG TPA: YciI family protein [Gammaproteobacteria bacterium]|nr:YciI family protein [Gammaproteobacteria bacterium]